MTGSRRVPKPVPTKAKAKVTSDPSGMPTDVHTMAGRAVGALTAVLAENTASTRMLIGTVQSHHAGPPFSVTVVVSGQVIPNVRYIGDAPIVGSDVVLITMPGTYVCLGSLA